MEKLSVAVIFGGKSTEHEVSVESARNVIRFIDRKKYNVIPVGIDKNNRWFLIDEKDLFSNKDPFSIENNKNNGVAIPIYNNGKFLIKDNKNEKIIDVVFPIIHGAFGEDGTIQGFLRFFDVPFVGANILSSAIGINKDITKRLLKEAEIPVANFLVYKKNDKNISFQKTVKKLGLPIFIKPVNLGSSVGISKVNNKKEFISAINNAFSYDNSILAEEFIEGKEIECAVFGNDKPQVSVLGEIIPSHEFYSYKAKYLDKNGATFSVPANIPKDVERKIKSIALKVYETLCCDGMARVDFFVTKNNKIFVNEINTVPGFTSISMYPKLWNYSGMSFQELTSKLIEFAIDRYKKEKKLNFSYEEIN